jgi:mono/diheme cytochrome c family protein
MNDWRVVMHGRGAMSLATSTIGVALPLLFLAATGFAQTIPSQVAATSAASTAAQRGKETFQRLCTGCHGDRGDGKGAAFKQHPSDLTRLAKRTGTSAAAVVEAALKGTDPLVAHGSPGMMVWGAFFLADANGDQPTAEARIQEVARFIESIQVR